MINFPKSNYVSAGRHAYQIGVDLQNNPYSKEPQKTAWEEGWIKESGRFVKQNKPNNKRK